MTSKESSSIAPLVLLGETRKRSLEERLAQCLKEWCQERCVSSTTDATSVSAQFDTRPHEVSVNSTLADGAKWIAVGAVGGAAMIYVLAKSNAPNELLGLPGKSRNQDATVGPIAGSLMGSLLESMAVAILMRAQYQAPQISTSAVALNEFDAADRLPFWWHVSCGESLSLLLHPQLVALLAPAKKSSAGAPVEKRRTAIGSESVTLQAVLGHADVSVGELASLRINDVIVLGNAITQTGQLRTRAGLHVANVSVGRLDGKRAVVVTRQ